TFSIALAEERSHTGKHPTLTFKLNLSFFFLSDAVSLHVVPNRLQFFEYESVIFYCEGAVYWEVVHNIKGKINLCSHTNKKTPAGSSCTIKNVYTDDSGEYWCETEGGKRSNTGSVILEVPAVPVMEGEAVTLHCRNKTTSSSFTSNFNKDGRHVHRSSTGEMTIQRVSKSDEGLYKCNISGPSTKCIHGGKTTEQFKYWHRHLIGGKRNLVTPRRLGTVIWHISAIDLFSNPGKQPPYPLSKTPRYKQQAWGSTQPDYI
uniref:Ig-like domain-containing protein n=1 Tax=Amphilophus citrinellus TaxID=61819 RepID=A0A3Q0RTJ7_AMPCI